MPQPLLVIGGVVVALLVVVLVRTLLRLRQQQARTARTEAALSGYNQREHEARLKSLEMIPLAALAGDCELSEACLRVRGLLVNYPGLRGAPEFAPIEAMYEDIRHFDVGESRRGLTARELERQDAERFEIEGRHRGAVLAAFRALRERAVELGGSPYDLDVARSADLPADAPATKGARDPA